MPYFTLYLKFVSNILSMIVESIFPLKLFPFDCSRKIAYFFISKVRNYRAIAYVKGS